MNELYHYGTPQKPDGSGSGRYRKDFGFSQSHKRIDTMRKRWELNNLRLENDNWNRNIQKLKTRKTYTDPYGTKRYKAISLGELYTIMDYKSGRIDTVRKRIDEVAKDLERRGEKIPEKAVTKARMKVQLLLEDLDQLGNDLEKRAINLAKNPSTIGNKLKKKLTSLTPYDLVLISKILTRR